MFKAAVIVFITAPLLTLVSCAADPSPSSPTVDGQTSAEPGAKDSRHGTSLKAELKLPDGTVVADADMQFDGGFASLAVHTVSSGKLTPGFHALHIHSVGKCEPHSVSPTGGPIGDFNSAGGHFEGHTHHGQVANWDLSSLQVRGDGSANLLTTSDAFDAEELLAGAGTALMIHEKGDNFGNIPPERYRQINGSPPPDQTTLMSGDSGGRAACGVITQA